MYSLVKLFRYAYRIIPQLRGLLKHIFKKCCFLWPRRAPFHYFRTSRSLSIAVEAMELGEQYVISLKTICCSKRWKDLLLRNKLEETVFFFFFLGGGGGGVFLADIFVFLYF